MAKVAPGGGGGDKHPQASIAGIVLIRLVLGLLCVYQGVTALASLPATDSLSFIDQFNQATGKNGLLITGNIWPGLAHFLQYGVHDHIISYAWLVMLVWLLGGLMLLLGFLTRLAAFCVLVLSLVFLLSTVYTADGGANMPFITQNIALIAMELAVIIAAAGRTWGIDRLIGRNAKVKLLW